MAEHSGGQVGDDPALAAKALRTLPVQKDLRKIADKCGNNGEKLLTLVGLQLTEIQGFLMDASTSSNAFFQGLVFWLGGNADDSDPVNWSTLLTAMEDAGMARDAGEWRQKIIERCAASLDRPRDAGQSGNDKTQTPGQEEPRSNVPQSATSKDQQTMPPSTTPVEDQRTLALREAHEKLKSYYTKSAKWKQFVKLALVERPPKVDKTKIDVKEFLEATDHGIDRYTGEQKNIEYRTILTSTGSDSGKRVLISGSPGSGKTTLAHQLCRDLYSAHLPNQYQLVLFTELKAFRSYTSKKNKEASLLTLLQYSGLPEPDNLCSMIEKEEGRGVAIILDGYDEISDDSCKTLAEWVSEVFCDAPDLKVRKCDVFITTRPSQLSQLTRNDSFHLEILGFSSSDIKCYIKACDFKGAPDRAEEVIRRLTGFPLVRGLCSNPRALEVACKVLKHQDEEPLPANLSGIFFRYLRYQLEFDLIQRQPPVEARIKNLLSISEELFPAFYTLCSLAYDCCLRQQLMLEKQELGEVKNYINSRGSVYNLLFGVQVDSPSEMSCVYQCDHKMVMEALAAVHIAVLSPAEQQQIWEKWFTAPHMAQVWMMFCGLTGLKSVDLRRLCLLAVSRSREVAKDLKPEAFLSKGKLVMVSLFEASNDEEANRVLPVLLKDTVRGCVRSQHDVLVLAYSITLHPHLSRVWLDLLQDCSELDLQPLTTSIKNVKAVELRCFQIEPMLAVLPSAVIEELSLDFNLEVASSAKGNVSYKGLGDALRDCPCLRSLTINSPPDSTLWTELESVLNSNRLTEFHMEDNIYVEAPSTETLKNLLVYREKCSLMMKLNNPQQLSALLSGLKRADKLKELDLKIKSSGPEVNPDQWLVTRAEVEELVATHPHLVKVDVNNYHFKSDLLVAVAEGAIRNKNITHLGLGSDETHAVHPLLCSPTADHITSIRAWYLRDHHYDGDDAWSEDVIDGPMARQTCHLDLEGFTSASLGLLLSKLNRTATKLKDFCLEVSMHKEDQDPVDVRAVETAFVNCNLHKLGIEHAKPSAQLCRLFSAILNGLAANTATQVDSCIYSQLFDEEETVRHLSQQTLQRFEVFRSEKWSFIISRDPSYPSAWHHHNFGPGSAPALVDNRMVLEKAIERNGSVTLHITRCILTGPPRVGKSCFKHLLVHNKPCHSLDSEIIVDSTPVMEAPVVLTSMWTQQGKEGTWKELTTVDLEKLVNKCAMDGKYNDGKTDDDDSTAKPPTEQPKNEGHNSFAEVTADQPIVELKPSPPKIALTPDNPLVSKLPTDEHPQANPAPQQARLNDKPNPVVPDNLSQRLSKFFHVMSRGDIGVDLNNLNLIHVFDCGGQLAFQDTIPLLINAPCAFIAIFNAFEGLDEEIELTYCLGGKELPTGHKETQWNMLLSILSSIQALQYKCHQDLNDLIKEQPEHSSPIAVVGTHKDKFGHSVTDDIKGIESRLSKLSDSKPCCFIKRKGQILNLVGNLTTDDLDQVAPLREAISENATFSLDLPIPWLILELFTRSILNTEKEEEKKAFYRYLEFKELCSSDPLRMDESDFKACIRILHILGFYAFYSLRELSEDENWICIDAATLYKEVSQLLMVQHVNDGNNTTAKFKKTGRIPLDKKSLKEIFHGSSGISIKADPKWLMHVLLHIGLAAKVKMEPDSDSEAFIPLALPPGLSDIPSITSVAPLCFTLDFTKDGCKHVSANSTGIPRGTFSRLVVLLLSEKFPGDVNEWKIWDEDSKRSCIKFNLMDYSCAVYLKESMGHIEASAVLGWTMLPRTGSNHDRILVGSSLCQDIRKTLTAALQKAFELVFDTRCQPKVVCGFACSECDSSNGYNHLAIIREPSLATDKRFPAKEYTAVCVFKKAKSVLTPDQLIWFKPGPFIPDSKFRYMDENKLWILEELSTAGPHSSPGDAPIEDVDFFLAYIDEMTSHLVILRVALGLSKFAPPGDSPSDKCIYILEEWLKRTASPTVGKFCKCLEKAPSFNNLRETILPTAMSRH